MEFNSIYLPSYKLQQNGKKRVIIYNITSDCNTYKNDKLFALRQVLYQTKYHKYIKGKAILYVSQQVKMESTHNQKNIET